MEMLVMKKLATREAWLEARGRRIGGSDAAALLVDRAFDVFPRRRSIGFHILPGSYAQLSVQKSVQLFKITSVRHLGVDGCLSGLMKIFDKLLNCLFHLTIPS